LPASIIARSSLSVTTPCCYTRHQHPPS